MNNILFKYFPELNLEFSNKPDAKKHQRFLSLFISVIFAANNRWFKHKNGSGFVLHIKFIQDHIGNTARYPYEEMLAPYVWTSGSYKAKTKDAYARQWFMTEKFKEKSAQFIADQNTQVLLTTEWQTKVRDIMTNLQTPKVKIKTLSVTTELINAAIEELKADHETTTSDLSTLSVYKDQQELEYLDTACGRLYHPMQLIKSEMKAKIFKGHRNYDIEAAAPTILWQYVERNIPDVKIDAIKNYTLNKTEIREQLSDELGINIKTVKTLFTALFFGQKVPTYEQLELDKDAEVEDEFLNNICKEIGYEKTKLLIENKTYTEIADEVREVVRAIGNFVKPAEKVDGEWILTNSANAVKKMTTWDAGKAAAHVYFGIERNITDIIREFVGESGVLLMHDGFIIDHKVDTKKLAKQIKERTNYTVAFSQEIL